MNEKVTDLGVYERFKEVYEILHEHNKVTNIATNLGYTTTRQLYNVLEGKNFITTKALIQLFRNYNVNPNFIFAGESVIFLDNLEGLNLKDEIVRLEETIVKIGNALLKAKTKISSIEDEKRKLIEVTYQAIQNKSNTENKELNNEATSTLEQVLEEFEEKNKNE
jgi:hypothetical protein